MRETNRLHPTRKMTMIIENSTMYGQHGIVTVYNKFDVLNQ
jgi:hypothetical protein